MLSLSCAFVSTAALPRNIASEYDSFGRNIRSFGRLLSSHSFIMGEDGRLSGPRRSVYISTIEVYTTRSRLSCCTKI